MAGFVLVWGTRIKEEPIGSVAIDCPACGERVIADTFRVLKASHLYFIRGKYKEVQKYVKCRLCAVPSELPERAIPKSSPSSNIITPSANFIKESNPELINTSTPSSDEDLNITDGISRHVLSLFQGIFQEINKQKSSSKAAGNAEGLILIVLMAGLILSMLLYEKFNNPQIFLTTLWSLTIILVIFFYKFQFILMFKAAHNYLNLHIQRYLEFKKMTFQDLLEMSTGLRGEFKIVAKYLSWAKTKIELVRYSD
ncbi:MAG: hypothetical protein ACL93V_16680 [Candidatus Electrothrix sp. YB6]